MPLKLVPPRTGKTPYWYIRGTYLGIYVDRSSKTGERKVAIRELARLKSEIEEGRFAERDAPTFASAAAAYMNAGGERRFVTPLLLHFKECALSSIDQEAIDDAALAIYPDATNATRNRQVYTVVSAILKQAGVDYKLKRPKGALGKQRTEWLWPEQAFALFNAADEVDKELGVLLRLLCYTGMRLGEALALRWTDVRLDEGFAYVRETKTGVPRPVFLPPLVIQGMRVLDEHSNRTKRDTDNRTHRVFRFTKSGRLYQLLRLAQRALGDDWTSLTFHTLRHTYATWMRRYAGMDERGLVGTGAWKDRQSVARYAHVIVTEEAQKAALLPVEETWTREGGKGKGGASD